MMETSALLLRSKLFVPASRPELFEKALNTAADAVCFDLEDAVLSTQKPEARNALRNFLSRGPQTNKTIIVRVNQVNSADFEQDLNAAVLPVVSMVSLPKVQDPQEIQRASIALSALERERNLPRPIALLPTIESPRGLRVADAIASADNRVAGLQLGLADLLQPLGIRQSEETATYEVRLRLRLAAAEGAVPCFDSACTNLADDQEFIREALTARNLGFAGKSCIHPQQIESANRIFSPNSDEIADSARIIRAAEAASQTGQGVCILDGRMIDEPFVQRAKAVLALAEKIRILETNR